ncbi:MAG: hypothetical protein LBG76_00620 [Treponema sp.]|jgi:hypothetical protein|nr:hypothetical protein [Treponema sp.]
MKKNRFALPVVLILTITALFLAAGCPNPASGPETQTPEPAAPTWSPVSSVNELIGVWEGTTRLELAGDDESGLSEGSIGIIATIIYERLEDSAEIILKFDYSDYLDAILADNSGSGYTKDSLWTYITNSLSGSGYIPGNYVLLTRQTVYANHLLNADDLLINGDKTKLKQIMAQHEFALMGIGVTGDAELILDKIAQYPASLFVKGEDMGGGEEIIRVKILSTSEDVEKAILGIGQVNAAFDNDGDAALYNLAATSIRGNLSEKFRLPAGKYFVKASIYRGSFIGWLHLRSESFTVDNGDIVTVTYDYIEYEPGTYRMGLAVSR